MKTLSSIGHIKNLKYLSFSCIQKKYGPLEKFTANYNWRYVFKSKKTNKEAPNAISLIKLSLL